MAGGSPRHSTNRLADRLCHRVGGNTAPVFIAPYTAKTWIDPAAIVETDTLATRSNRSAVPIDEFARLLDELRRYALRENTDEPEQEDVQKEPCVSFVDGHRSSCQCAWGDTPQHATDSRRL